MDPVAFESLRIPLHLVHLTAGAAGIAVAVHLFWRMAQGLTSPRPFLAKALRWHADALFTACAAAWISGALIYPWFRIRVRYAYLDQTIPWATGLFEIKEWLATLVLIPAVGLWLLTRRLDPAAPKDRPYLPIAGTLLVAVLFVFAFNSIYGWYLGAMPIEAAP